MISSTLGKDFLLVSGLKYISKSTNKIIEIPPEKIVQVIVNSNLYLASLIPMFEEIGFDIYETLGQRNLSGFVGEVFVKSFQKLIDGYACNPHGDGRPDILDVTSKTSFSYFQNYCFSQNEDDKPSPIRSSLAPFKFGGLEVKSTIGNPVHNYKALLERDLNLTGFSVGLPRINYLKTITYWGHHTSCENLVGLYYDYAKEVNGAPQIFAVMHSELDSKTDWNTVSVGRVGSKKTSNTSLTPSGKGKLFNNVIAVTRKKAYLEKLKSIGLNL